MLLMKTSIEKRWKVSRKGEKKSPNMLLMKTSIEKRWKDNTTKVWKKLNFFQNLIFSSYTKRMKNKSVSVFKFPYPIKKISIIWQRAPEWRLVKIDSTLRKVSLLKLSVWVCSPGKIMLCHDFCTTVVFTDLTIFSSGFGLEQLLF